MQSVIDIADPWTLGQGAAVVLDMIGFTPTGPEQARILRTRKPFKLVVGGGQAGKSITTSVDAILHFVEDRNTHPDEQLLYWLVAADYERTRPEFGYIIEFLNRIAQRTGLKVDYSKIVNPGWIEVAQGARVIARWETKSAKDPRTLAMFAPHGIIGCEASQLDVTIYLKCLERLTPRSGWLSYSGTYESSLGFYPSLAKAWQFGGKDEQSFKLPAPTNKVLYPEGENDPKFVRLRATAPDAYYRERIMGEAAPPEGIVFPTFRPDIHMRELAYDPELPVFIWEDPGYGHAHAIEVAQAHAGGQIHVFDEIYERGIVTADLIDICTKRMWWQNTHKTLVIDPNYANQHQGTDSIADIWRIKTSLITSGRKIKIAEGVDRLRGYLKVDALTNEPGILFDCTLVDKGSRGPQPRCEGVLSELGAYPNPFDGQTHVYSYKLDSEGNNVSDEPEQKWNDGISAIIYGIVAEFGLITEEDSGYAIMQRREPAESRRSHRLSRHRSLR